MRVASQVFLTHVMLMIFGNDDAARSDDADVVA